MPVSNVNDAVLISFAIRKYLTGPCVPAGAACLWEAESIDALDSYLRSKVGDTSKETYYEVNVANAIGLPA